MKRLVLLVVSLMLIQYGVAAGDVDALIKQAESGNADAQFRLVNHYGQGIGVPKDLGKAKYWRSKAAENGNAEAQYWTGYTYFYGQDQKRNVKAALEWYERSANQGYGPAQFMAGYIYDQEVFMSGNTQPNLAKAVHWYQLAASQDVMGAQFHLGCFKYFGIGVAPNRAEADALIHRAAGKGQRGAQRFLQNMGSGESLLEICEIHPEPSPNPMLGRVDKQP